MKQALSPDSTKLNLRLFLQKIRSLDTVPGHKLCEKRRHTSGRKSNKPQMLRCRADTGNSTFCPNLYMMLADLRERVSCSARPSPRRSVCQGFQGHRSHAARTHSQVSHQRANAHHHGHGNFLPDLWCEGYFHTSSCCICRCRWRAESREHSESPLSGPFTRPDSNRL